MPYQSLAPCSGGVKLIRVIDHGPQRLAVNSSEKVVTSTTVHLEPLPIKLYPVTQ
jgi:hypothetical protein